MSETDPSDDGSENTLDLEKEIKRPPEGAVPPYLWKLNIFLGIVALSVTAIFHFTLFNPSPNKVLSEWVNQCLLDFEDKNTKYWRQKYQVSPSSVKIILTRKPLDEEEVIWGLIENSGLSKKIERDKAIYLDSWEFDKNVPLLKEQASFFFDKY